MKKKSVSNKELDLSMGSTLLNDYHKLKSKVACLAVEEMSKQTYTAEQMREQAYMVKTRIGTIRKSNLYLFIKIPV